MAGQEGALEQITVAGSGRVPERQEQGPPLQGAARRDDGAQVSSVAINVPVKFRVLQPGLAADAVQKTGLKVQA